LSKSKLSKQHLKFISLAASILVCLFIYLVNPFSIQDSEKPNALGISDAGLRALAIAALMITLWITEALPMPVVALLPLIFFPLLRISTLKETAAPYADDVIFLFMGGFMLALAIEKWNLHKRIALGIVRFTGTSGDRIILGFILATGALSMWLSNTATTMMMFPIALSVIQVMKENHKGEGNMSNFSLTMMLSIAYASNIGGIATIVGTPPNGAYVLHIKQALNYEIGFVNWMLICAPLSIVMLFCLYWVMVKWLFRNGIKSDHATRAYIDSEIHKLGPISTAEKRVLVIFSITALLWILREPINNWQSAVSFDDTIIAIMCAVALFICPSGKEEKVINDVTQEDNDGVALLAWRDTTKMAWGILILFGGGLTLANALKNGGLITQLGDWMGRFAGNHFVLVLLVVVITIFVSEVMSNVAQVMVFGPVVTAMALKIGMDPLLLGIPMTLAASCAGMLPMGTPPNAIVFASGHIKLRQMTKAGFAMNIVAIVLITLFCWFLLPLLMKVG
jgi:solute carrier family 13 (sodium-dependent dicarboxylate transporter), member 2/3/5